MRIQRLIAAETPIAPRPTGEQFGAAEGRAVQRLGNELGRTAQLASQIFDSYQQQVATSRGLDAEDQLRRFAEEQEQNPDFESRERVFLERAAELRSELGRGLTPRRRVDFERILSQARNRHAVTVRAGARGAALQAAEIETNEILRKAAVTVANSDDPLDQMTAHGEGRKAIQDFGENFGQTPERIEESLRGFDRMIGDAVFVQKLREDPVHAYNLLEEPGAGLTVGRTPAEIEQMRTRAINEVESRILRADQMELTRIRKAEAARKEAARDVMVSIATEARTEEGVSVDFIRDNADLLGGEKAIELMEWAVNTGGRIQRTKVDPNVLEALRARAASGEDVTGEIFDEEVAGNLGPAERNALLTINDDRFDPAFDYLDGAISEFTRGPARQRVNEAKAEMVLWAANHPEASRADALEQAREIAERAQIYDTSKMRVAKLPPPFAVFEEDGRTMRANETEQALTERLLSGDMDEDEFDRAMDQYEAYMEAQRAEQSRAVERDATEGNR
ncbi:MAG: hypothetical protein NXI30_04520 [bacterium]|nr:hypothetical protein [bacterium]